MGREESGFTIIETMLYLGVTGLLAIGVLTSAGHAINVQRYRDAVDSLVTYLQSQYDETVNVQIDHATDLSCAANHIDVGSGLGRGMGDCVVLGKFVQTTDGTSFTSATVFGKLSSTPASSDLDAVKNAAPFTSTDTVVPSTYRLEWGARILQPHSNTTQAPLSILIVRSPASGEVMSFVGYSSGDTPMTLTNSAPADTLLCVEPVGFLTNDRMGALLAQGTSNSSGVKRASGGVC